MNKPIRYRRCRRGDVGAPRAANRARFGAKPRTEGQIMKCKCCVECAVILCQCGAYHGTDGTVAVESDRGPLYVFAQSPEAIDECDIRSQYALCDDEVDRLAERCEHCERMDDEDGAEVQL